MWQLRLKASSHFFLRCCCEKLVKYFTTALLYLKFTSSIVSGNTFWKNVLKCYQLSSNVIKLSPNVSYPLGNITSRERPVEILYVKQNIQWKHYSHALKIVKICDTTWDYYLLWAYCVLIRKFPAATKFLKTT